VFVQVGLAAFVLMAFNVFVLDYGMMWIARGQAQNAADAGALAGALARGYDDFEDPPHPAWIVGQSAQESLPQTLSGSSRGHRRCHSTAHPA
jgi:hypothetical protein